MGWYDFVWVGIVLSPLVIFYSRLVLTNVLVPYFKKKSRLEEMRKRSDWPDIERTVTVLEKLFKRNHAKITSVAFRKINRIKNREFIYGEIDFLSFHRLLEKTKPQSNDVFYDLGSGAGKAVFAAAFLFHFSKSCGIELLEPLYKKARDKLNQAKLLFQNKPADDKINYVKQIASIEFIKDSFLSCDFYDADIIYVAATCLSHSTWESLIRKMSKLKSGTRIIVATKEIQHEGFERIYQGIELMSWGLCPVNIYRLN